MLLRQGPKPWPSNIFSITQSPLLIGKGSSKECLQHLLHQFVPFGPGPHVLAVGKVSSQGFHQMANTQSWIRHTSGLPSWHHHHGFSTKEINFWKQIGFAMKNISPVITWATTWSNMTHSWGMFLQRTFYTDDVSTYSHKKNKSTFTSSQEKSQGHMQKIKQLLQQNYVCLPHMWLSRKRCMRFRILKIKHQANCYLGNEKWNWSLKKKITCFLQEVKKRTS